MHVHGLDWHMSSAARPDWHGPALVFDVHGAALLLDWHGHDWHEQRCSLTGTGSAAHDWHVHDWHGQRCMSLNQS